MGIAWDGSVANKMAAALISQLAQCCKKPAYIASELHKLDRRTAQGHPIILERRIQRSFRPAISTAWTASMSSTNSSICPPAHQITGPITERGVIAPATVSLNRDHLEAQLLNV